VDDLVVRLSVLLYVLVPFAFFIASIYLALHILFARLVSGPESPVLWFFAVVTGPLTWPIRAVLPAGTPEPRVRSVALVVYALLWLGSRVLLAGLAGPTAK
jgi:hypothetical protein